MEPTKVCSICNDRKPWSAFYPAPTGSPRWACIKCETAAAAKRLRDRRKANPEPFREAQRRRYRENRQNPEWVAERRDRDRRRAERARRAKGVPERAKRGPSNAPLVSRESVDAGPFREWMRYIMNRDGVTASTVGDEYGVPSTIMRKIERGDQERVEVSTVERALMNEGSMTLMDLYPELYGCVERNELVVSQHG